MIDLTARSRSEIRSLPASAVTIDFYKTLVDVDFATPSMCESLTSWGYPCDEETEARFSPERLNGKHTPQGVEYDEWRLNRVERLCEAVGVPPAKVTATARALIEIDRSWTVKPLAGAEELLQALAATATPYLILTNWDYPLEPYLEQAGFSPKTAHLTSRDAGARKPNATMFRRAAEMMGVDTGVVHLGDRWDCDVEGALGVDWVPCWLTPDESAATRAVPYVPDLNFLTNGRPLPPAGREAQPAAPPPPPSTRASLRRLPPAT